MNENQHLTKFYRVLSAPSTEPGNGMNPQVNLVWPQPAHTFDALLSLWETKFCDQGHMQLVVKFILCTYFLQPYFGRKGDDEGVCVPQFYGRPFALCALTDLSAGMQSLSPNVLFFLPGGAMS